MDGTGNAIQLRKRPVCSRLVIASRKQRVVQTFGSRRGSLVWQISDTWALLLTYFLACFWTLDFEGHKIPFSN
ncbi:MAG: hypothetical protein DRR08_13190 [Candidatus Parabeggiatoa sp. nov. 2]|nr:MAG: hypothetical protein B6247_05890 [Beggiatoa sp. 4572_84]RKZ59736.1 MAG: hypothetical protein DRR08_13190 [Gammaproteobacteria bacterium]